MRKYLFEAVQQVSCSGERSPLGAYGSSEDIAEMPQLVAALDDECQGVVVIGSQLVTMQDHNLGPRHLLLIHKHNSFGFLMNLLHVGTSGVKSYKKVQ